MEATGLLDRSGFGRVMGSENLTRVCSKGNGRRETGNIYYGDNSPLNSILVLYEDCYSELLLFAR